MQKPCVRPIKRQAYLLGPFRNNYGALASAQAFKFIHAPFPHRVTSYDVTGLAVRKRRQPLRAGSTGKGAHKRKHICFHVPQHTSRRTSKAMAYALYGFSALSLPASLADVPTGHCRGWLGAVTPSAPWESKYLNSYDVSSRKKLAVFTPARRHRRGSTGDPGRLPCRGQGRPWRP